MGEAFRITLRSWRGRGTLIVAAYILFAMVGVWLVYGAAIRGAFDRLSATGEIRVEQAADRLEDQLERFRMLANLLARDLRVKAALSGVAPPPDVGAYLRDHVLTYGAERIELRDRSGGLIAASGPKAAPEAMTGPGLVTAALNGRLGRDHDLVDGTRRFQFSRGVILDQAPPSGLVIVAADIAALEFEWGVAPESIAFFDAAGVVFAANRPSLLLRQDREIAPADPRFEAFPPHQTRREGPHLIWRFAEGGDLPDEVLVIRREAPLIGMTALGFLDIAPAQAAARQQALLAAALFSALGLGGALIALWRSRVADRLALESAANARLEARVEERTAALKSTQDQLVQATKMTALGQMSAGIAHELNQPLAAIMNFAENGATFLDRGRPGDARANLGLISGQIERINRIIRHLRGFARAEEETIEPVDLVSVVDAALALLEAPISQSGAVLRQRRPAAPIWVRGGEVRLQQVIVNLITNALDAMAEQAAPQLDLTLAVADAEAHLALRDTGPGVAEPARVFEPFYTTKELGASKGLGLGLSISYGIVGGFGGRIEAANHPEGGAVFTVVLPLMEEARAA